jgi:outer membrane lipoprotein carrier protein
MLFANDFNNLKTFEASFTQTITNPSGNKVIYNGLIHIKEPYKIKWQYKNPIEKFVYINKHTVTIIEPELEQVIMTKLDQEINILNLLKNAEKVGENDYISNFNNIDYSLSIKDQTLIGISYIDEIENKVLISFQNVQQNHTIEENIFKFTIPLEYDVIKK